MADQQQTPWQRLQAALEGIRDEWSGLSTNPKLKFDAEREWLLQACEKSDYARDKAVANIDATCAALRNVASVGLTLDPARKLAYVLPRDNKMVYDLSYIGLMQAAVVDGAILWAQAHLVYEKDDFRLRGYDAPPVHERNPFAKERGEVIGVYVVAKTPGGDYLTNTMHVDDVNAIRNRSSAWKQYIATKDSNKPKLCPWNTDWAEMAKKTVVKNAAKYWHSEAVDRAIHFLNTEGEQGVDLTPEDDSRTRVDIWRAKIDKATSGEEVNKLWKEALAEFKAAEDPDGSAAVRKLCVDRAAALKVVPGATPPAKPTTPPEEVEAAQILAGIATAEGAALDALGNRIDALPKQYQDKLNDAFNARCAELEGAN